MARGKKAAGQGGVINPRIAALVTGGREKSAEYTGALNDLVAMLRSGVDYLGPATSDGKFHLEVAAMVALLEGLHDELEGLQPQNGGQSVANEEAVSASIAEREDLLVQLADARNQVDALKSALRQFQEQDSANQDTIVGLEEALANSQAALATARVSGQAATDKHGFGDVFRETSGQPAGKAAASIAIRYPDRDMVEMPLLGDLRIGRSEPSEIRVGGPTVSRMHAILKWDGRVASIHDCDSTNGVFVNGTRVREQKLEDGDELRVGSLHCIFHLKT